MSPGINSISKNHKEIVRAGIHSGAELNAAYLLMNILAATIASYGLFANSPAVVIGAMIIAMLLGPITGISLALVDNDLMFLWRSIRTLFVGASVVIATGFIIGIIHNDVPITREILARTSPNLADLVIALAGGAAGAYATVSPKLSVAFVGVAIATALVPPLCAANILFARGEMELGYGALLLVFTNIVAIQFASSFVFWCTGFRKISLTQGLPFLTFLKNNAISMVVLGLLAFVLTDSLHEILSKRLYESAIQSTLRKEIDSSAGSHLVEVRFEETAKGVTIVRAVVRGPNPPTGAQVATLESKLPTTPKGKSVELRIRFIHTDVITKEGPTLEGAEFTIQE